MESNQMSIKELTEVETIHAKVRKEMKILYPIKVCSKCGSSRRIEVANIRGHEYSRNVNDYIYLCDKCHRAFDRMQRVKFVLSATTLLKKIEPLYNREALAAIAVAEAYGPNVSKGILAMEVRIVELEKENKRMKERRE